MYNPSLTQYYLIHSFCQQATLLSTYRLWPFPVFRDLPSNQTPIHHRRCRRLSIRSNLAHSFDRFSTVPSIYHHWHIRSLRSHAFCQNSITLCTFLQYCNDRFLFRVFFRFGRCLRTCPCLSRLFSLCWLAYRQSTLHHTQLRSSIVELHFRSFCS